MSDERFYSRWSRLKTERAKAPEKTTRRAFAPVVEELPSQPTPAPVEEDSAEPTDSIATPSSDQAKPGETGDADKTPPELPEVDSLDYDSDYSGFMAEGVSDELRNLALRRLWRSNPLLANLDGLNDYDEDFTIAKTALGSIQSAYQALGGYGRKDEEELEADDQPASPEETTVEASDEPAVEAEEDTVEESSAPDQTASDDEHEKPLT